MHSLVQIVQLRCFLPCGIGNFRHGPEWPFARRWRVVAFLSRAPPYHGGGAGRRSPASVSALEQTGPPRNCSQEFLFTDDAGRASA